MAYIPFKPESENTQVNITQSSILEVGKTYYPNINTSPKIIYENTCEFGKSIHQYGDRYQTFEGDTYNDKERMIKNLLEKLINLLK